MTLEIEPGYVRVTDTNGHVCLDTRRKSFHRLSLVSKTINIPQLDVGTGEAPNGRTATYSVGSVAAGCTHLLGFCRITYSTGYSMLPSGYWYTVGGTLVPEIMRFRTISGVNTPFISSLQLLTFELVGNTVVLKEEVTLANDYEAGFNIKTAAMTIDCRIYAGRFN